MSQEEFDQPPPATGRVQESGPKIYPLQDESEFQYVDSYSKVEMKDTVLTPERKGEDNRLHVIDRADSAFIDEKEL